MRVPDLEAAYSRLSTSLGLHTYTGSRIQEDPPVIFAVDSGACPALFVKSSTRSAGPSVCAARVAFVPGESYALTYEDGSAVEDVYDGLLCLSPDRDDVSSFIQALQGLLNPRVVSSIGTNTLRSYFSALVKLFETSPSPNLSSERIGLWGELFLMRDSRGFKFWLSSWRSSVSPTFDFSVGKLRLEVKTTAGDERIHHFSHRQLVPESGEEVFVASLMVQETGPGLSLLDLINEARSFASVADDRIKIEQAARRAGMSAQLETGPVMNEDAARHSMMWYRAEEVPHFLEREPVGVSSTRYRADLSHAKAVSLPELENWQAKWAAIT
jgi:hypothetical protein